MSQLWHKITSREKFAIIVMISFLAVVLGSNVIWAESEQTKGEDNCVVEDLLARSGDSYREVALSWKDPTGVSGYELRYSQKNIINDLNEEVNCRDLIADEICYSEANVYNTQNWAVLAAAARQEIIYLEGDDPAGMKFTTGSAPEYYFSLRGYKIDSETDWTNYCPPSQIVSAAANSDLNTLEEIEITFQAGDTKGTISETRDNYIYEYVPDNNYGALNKLYYNKSKEGSNYYQRRALLRFPNVIGENNPLDISQRGLEQIPFNNTDLMIKSATWLLKGKSQGSGRAYKILQDWTEGAESGNPGQASWNDAQDNVAWEIPGANGSNDANWNESLRVEKASSEEWYFIYDDDLADGSYVNDWLSEWVNSSGLNNFGIILSDTSSGDDYFYASDYSSSQDQPIFIAGFEYNKPLNASFDINPPNFKNEALAGCDDDKIEDVDCNGYGSINQSFVFINFSSRYDICEWDFTTDGNIDSEECEEIPNYQYNEAGIYEVQLTISNASGQTDQVIHQIKVYEASFEVDPVSNDTFILEDCHNDRESQCAGSGDINTTFSFFNLSSDFRDNNLSYAWDFGDGGTSTSKDPSHQYNHPATYEVILTLTDIWGGSDQNIQQVEVLDSTAITAQITCLYKDDEQGNCTDGDQSNDLANSFSQDENISLNGIINYSAIDPSMNFDLTLKIYNSASEEVLSEVSESILGDGSESYVFNLGSLSNDTYTAVLTAKAVDNSYTTACDTNNESLRADNNGCWWEFTVGWGVPEWKEIAP